MLKIVLFYLQMVHHGKTGDDANRPALASVWNLSSAHVMLAFAWIIKEENFCGKAVRGLLRDKRCRDRRRHLRQAERVHHVEHVRQVRQVPLPLREVEQVRQVERVVLRHGEPQDLRCFASEQPSLGHGMSCFSPCRAEQMIR